MMKKMCRLIAVTVAALMCVGLFGCGDDETFEWKGRENARIVSFVDDSLVLLFNRRGYQKCQEGVGPLGYSDCIDGGTNDGLFLVNFREKKPVYWADTLDFGVNFMRGFYRDSTILFLAEYEKKIGFWKIGSLPQTLKKISWKSPCEGFDGKSPTQFRPWKDGDVLVINAKGCAYSVLDTATGDVDVLPLDGEYAWLRDCDDVTYLNGNVMCLKREDEDKVELLRNGMLVDSLKFDAFNAYVGDAYGGAVKWNGPFAQIYLSTIDPNSKLFHESMYYLNGLTKEFFSKKSNANLWVDNALSEFIDSAGDCLQYEPDDLKF